MFDQPGGDRKNDPHCPICRVAIAATTPLKVNITLNYLTSSLDVMCTNVGCQWSGKYDMAENHSSHCPRAKVKCENDGCNYVDMREAMPSHASSCVKRKTRCQNCGISMAKERLDGHIASLCSYSVISCPIGCEATFPRCHTTLHLSECPEKAIKCPVAGCTAIFRRKNSKEHVVTAASSHAVLQAGEVQRLRGIIHFKGRKPSLELHEECVYSFRWKLDHDWPNIEKTVASTDYRCPNGDRWRGLLVLKEQRLSLCLQLTSAVVPVTVEAGIVLMPGTEREKAFSFATTQVSEWSTVGNVPVTGNYTADGKIDVKFVMRYCQLKEKKF